MPEKIIKQMPGSRINFYTKLQEILFFLRKWMMNLTEIKDYFKSIELTVIKMPFLLNGQDAYKVIDSRGEFITVTKARLLSDFRNIPYFLNNEGK